MAFKSWTPFLMKYIWPPAVISSVLKLLGEWNRSSVKTKAILAVFFFPAVFCVGGLIFSVVYFVLFKLPSFILSLLGWLLLISLFSGGGLFCYEKITGKRVGKQDSEPYDYDVTPGAEREAGKNNSDNNNWFDDINMKWFKRQ